MCDCNIAYLVVTLFSVQLSHGLGLTFDHEFNEDFHIYLTCKPIICFETAECGLRRIMSYKL